MSPEPFNIDTPHEIKENNSVYAGNEKAGHCLINSPLQNDYPYGGLCYVWKTV